ncbi:MAG: hypothetical protein J1G06_02650 [Oscillospiraceae bacterium]|nr:hypothetical protein [Oscillospiraceae bacterium]
MRLKNVISGIAAFAMAVSSFTGLAITASAAPGDKTEVYHDTPAWSTLGGSTEIRTNYFGLDTATSAEASIHQHDGGSGDRRAYTYFADVTPEQNENVEIEFYLNIAGSNQNTSHFYLMSADSKANSDPTSGQILDIAYTSYLGSITVNGTPITNIKTDTGAAYQPTGNSKYAATGLIKYDVVLNYNIKKADVTVYGTTTETYKVDFIDKEATGFKGFYSTLGRALAGCSIYDVNVNKVEAEVVTYRTVTFDVVGTISTQTIVDGSVVESIPDTYNPGYTFKGWTKDDGEELYTTDEVAKMPITADTKFTAQYELDGGYVEAIASVSITGANSMTFGPDPDTAASNPYTVVINGADGTTITEDNLSSNVKDFNVVWDIDGFATKNDNPGQYCDSYGAFAKNNEASVSTSFELRNVPMNFYGLMTATITYNGETYTASKAVVALGNKTVDVNQILPEGGYPSDFDAYPDSLKDYRVSFDTYGAAADVVAGGWIMSGSDSGTAVITAEGENKFMRVSAPTAKKSHVLTKSIASPATQAIFEQDVRFNSVGGVITLTSKYPFWSSTSGYTNPVTVSYNGSTITLNGAEIKDNNDITASISSSTWYKVVLSVDKTTKTAFVKVYDANGGYVGGVDNVAWTEESTPTFYSIGMSNNDTGTIDFDNYSAYYPTADISTYTITASQDTLSIPNGDTADLVASLKTADGYDITGTATWVVLEEDMQEGVIVTPDESDSHKAKVTLAEGASAGEATVQVNIGGYTKTIVLNITSSAESVKFTKSSTSVSIPLDDNAITAEYAASVVDGDGTDLGRPTTLAVYDKANTNEYTLPAGITFDAATGILTVTKEAPAITFTIRATGKNSDGEDISKSVKVTVHGLSFDFGAGTDADVAEGFTAVSPDTSYTAARGYGIASGSVTAGGTASVEDANSDYLEGAMTFNANVQKGKNYTVEITYQGVLRTGYVNSDLASYPVETTDNYGTAAGYKELTTKTYTIAVPVDTLDLIVSAYTADGVTYPARVASITITKNADKPANAKPDIHHVGDSTAANNGSWAYTIDHNRGSYPELQALSTFYNNGAGGRNLCSYYTEGKLAGVLRAIEPGDIVMFGNNGTNGLGSSFEADVNYYLDAAEAMGAKIIINSYTPDGGASYYDSATKTFHGCREGGNSGENVTRAIAAERAASDPNYLGFVEIGKNADLIFNAYVADYAANGYDSADAAAAAIYSKFTDHNHYSGLPCDLMLKGYNGIPGIVEQLVEILGAEPAKTYTVTFTGDNATVAVGGKTVTSTTVKEGNSVSFTVTPASGYKVTEVKAGDTVLESANGVYTLANVTADTTVAITTEIDDNPPAKTYTVTFDTDVVDVNSPLDITVNSITVEEGGLVEFRVVQRDGADLVKVLADGEEITPDVRGIYAIWDIKSNVNVTTEWKTVVPPLTWIRYDATYDENGVLTGVTITPDATPETVENTATAKTFFWNDLMVPWTAVID